MVITRGGLVPEDCGPSGRVGNLISRPLRDAGSNTLGTEETGLSTGKVINVAGVLPVADFEVCTGTDPADPVHPSFDFGTKGRILRAYLGQGSSVLCLGSVVRGVNSSSGSWAPDDIGTITYFNLSLPNVWVDPLYAGEGWRIVSAPGTFSGHTILHSGPIDGTGTPIGLLVEQVTVGGNPNWWRMSYLAPGATVLFSDPPPPDHEAFSFHYTLEYSCNGLWWTDDFYGPPP